VPGVKLVLYIVATAALALLALNSAACAARFFRRDLWAGMLLVSLRKNVWLGIIVFWRTTRSSGWPSHGALGQRYGLSISD
jgi:hypothetical protein